ncbi:MAG: hypothetical protein R2832_03340 [Rhodothermales bacterium]
MNSPERRGVGRQLHCQHIVVALLGAALAVVPDAFAQSSVVYHIAFPNAVHHEANVEVTFHGVPENGPLQVRMSRSSPGRYAIHEFAKNVYRFEARGEDGKALEILRPDPYQWDVYGNDGGDVTVTYTIFADRAGGTYSGIDATHAHLNIPATFAWARDMQHVPITVTFEPYSPDWKVASQLFPTDDPYTFTAPDLQYFMDSPTELSNHAVRSWTVGSGSDAQEIRLTVHHQGTEAEVDSYAEMAEKVVAEQIGIYGEAPRYDVGYYTFIADYLPYIAGDGMEHRNSTIIASTRPLSTGAMGNLGTLSHEFFHSWNVERIRPQTLEPFDFEHANMSNELWFAEGFTSYYTGLAIRRAGLSDDDAYAASLGGTISAVVNSPGRQFFSAVEMSRQAPFVDAATFIDPTNFGNTFISYYTWGSAIGLGLDLTLRERFGKTLDDYMRAMWQKFGKTGMPYTLHGLRETLAEVTGDKAFASDFYDRYIEGHEVVDYEALLATAGLKLQKARPGRASWGARLEETEGGVQVRGYPQIGSTLYEAGLDNGDVIVTIGGKKARMKNLDAAKPGQQLQVSFVQRGIDREATLQVKESDSFAVVTFESLNMTPSAAQQQRRAEWFRSRAGDH